MINQKDIRDYMEGVIAEIKDIPVEAGSHMQSFKTMIKMTSRLHYVKTHLLNEWISKSDTEDYKILYDSIKSDEAFINIYRGVLGLEPKDFD